MTQQLSETENSLEPSTALRNSQRLDCSLMCLVCMRAFICEVNAACFETAVVGGGGFVLVEIGGGDGRPYSMCRFMVIQVVATTALPTCTFPEEQEAVHLFQIAMVCVNENPFPGALHIQDGG